MFARFVTRLAITAVVSAFSAAAFGTVTNDVFIIRTAQIADLYSATFDGALAPCTGAEPDPDACTFFGGEPGTGRAITIASSPATGASGTLDVDYDDATGEIVQINSLRINLPDAVLTIQGTTTVTVTQGNGLPVANDTLFIESGIGTLGRALGGVGAVGQGTADADQPRALKSKPPLIGSGLGLFEHDDAPNSVVPDFAIFSDVVDSCTGAVCALIPLLSLDGIRYRILGTVDSGSFQLQAQTANNSIYKVNFTTAAGTDEMVLPDLNGNGANEYAVVRSGSVNVEIRDGSTGHVIRKKNYHPAGFAPDSGVTIPDLNGNGLAELGVVGVNGGNIKLRVADAATNTTIKKFSFYLSGHDPYDLATIADVTGNGLPDVALLSRRLSDGAIQVQVRDAKTGARPFADITFLNAGFSPKALVVLPDVNGNGIQELGVFAVRNADNRAVVEIREGNGMGGFSRIWFLRGTFKVIDVAVGPDTDGNGVPELAALAERISDGRIVVERRNAAGPPAPTRRWFFPEGGWQAEAFVALADTGDADTMPEYAVLAVRSSNHQPAVEIRNARDTAGMVPANRLRRLFLNAKFYPRSIVDLGNTNGATNLETNLGVISIRKLDGRAQLEVRDARGASNTRHIWFKK